MKQFGLIIMVVALMTNTGWAQKDPKALAILDAMSDKYQNTEAFKAKLVYKLENPGEKLNETFRGEITVMGEKYRLKIGEQEIINNGSTNRNSGNRSSLALNSHCNTVDRRSTSQIARSHS